jgi:hypothetical protein
LKRPFNYIICVFFGFSCRRRGAEVLLCGEAKELFLRNRGKNERFFVVFGDKREFEDQKGPGHPAAGRRLRNMG